MFLFQVKFSCRRDKNIFLSDFIFLVLRKIFWYFLHLRTNFWVKKIFLNKIWGICSVVAPKINLSCFCRFGMSTFEREEDIDECWKRYVDRLNQYDVIIALLTNDTGFGTRMVELVTWTVQSGAVLTGVLVRKRALSAYVVLPLEKDKTFHLKPYLPLSGRGKHQLQKNISVYWLIKDNFNLHGQSKWAWIHMKVQLMSFVVQGLFFKSSS